MYSEKDLKIVEKSVPIYVKDDATKVKKKPKRGHFKHRTGLVCAEKELSPVRRYTTALVYDFDSIGPIFAFLYSRDDAPYVNKNPDRIMRTLAMTVNFDWAYLDKQQLEVHEIYVRGWWDIRKKKNFTHKTGKLWLKDHVDFDDAQLDGEGQMINPEYGIKFFIPPTTGVYRDCKDIEQIGTWDEKQIYENTYVHPLADKAVGIIPPAWSRYGKEDKPVRRKRSDREAILVQQMRDERAAQLAQLERDALRGVRGDRPNAPRRARRREMEGLAPIVDEANNAQAERDEGIRFEPNLIDRVDWAPVERPTR